MYVADASVVVDYLFDAGERGQWATQRVLESELLHAPHLLDLEVAATARRLVARDELSERRAYAGLSDLADLRVERYPAVHLLDRIWRLRASLTAYDASYIALAEALELPLLTTDTKLARAHGHKARVEAFAPGT